MLLRLPPDDQGFGHGGIQSQHQSTERSLEKSSVQGTFLGEGGMTPQMAGGLGWRCWDLFFGGVKKEVFYYGKLDTSHNRADVFFH